VPEFKVEWSFSEVVQADDEQSALALMRERVDKLIEPRRFRVRRSIRIALP
jgi:hypothetical protein